jgi:MFS family permease
MLGFSTYAALLPGAARRVALSQLAGGLVGGMFFAGYVATVSLWTALTDRVDARWVYLAGSLLAAAAARASALAPPASASAVLFQVVLGRASRHLHAGLRLLSDRISGPYQSRYIAFYTSFFGIGTALSLAIAGCSRRLRLAAAFLVRRAGPLLAALFGGLLIRGRRPGRRQPPSRSPRFSARGVAQDHGRSRGRPVTHWAMSRIASSCSARAAGWSPSLPIPRGCRPAGQTFPWNFAAIAAVVNLVSVPASIVGNEIALRIGRRQWIQIAMVGSGACGVALACSGGLHWSIVVVLLGVYSMLVLAESATLTAGLVATVPSELRGAALGLYSLAGFGGGMLGPSIFGLALDLGGGKQGNLSWVLGYAAIGAGCLAAPLVVRIFAKPR